MSSDSDSYASVDPRIWSNTGEFIFNALNIIFPLTNCSLLTGLFGSAHSFNVIFRDSINIQFAKFLCKNDLKNYNIIFTDGSRSAEGRVGYAVFSPSPQILGAFNLGLQLECMKLNY